MNVFLDCGTNIGQGFDRIITQYPTLNYPDLIVHMFEPLPDAYEILKTKYTFAIVHQCAVWNEDTTRILNIEDAKMPMCGNRMLGHTTNILQDNFNMPKHVRNSDMAEWPPKHSYITKCIDFSKFIKNNFQHNDNIILKLDIEGSEFEVLDKMILDNTLAYIKHMHIEWHPHMRKETCDIHKYETIFKNLNINLLTPKI